MSQHARYAFLDLFRTLFVVLMVEGHAVRALLSPDLQASAAFRFHELLHALTGPGFLFGAGCAFAIATQRRREHLQSVTPAFFRRLWRAVLLILVGYALHLPFFSLRKTLEQSTAEQWTHLLAFGPLQCIGVSLVLLRALFLVARSDRIFLLLLAVMTPAVVFATPLIWDPGLSESVPPAVSMALSGGGGSYYPLFPFSAFVFAGAGVSWMSLRISGQNGPGRLALRLSAGGAGLLLLGFALDLCPVRIYPSYDFWYTSPAYFLIRLGILLIVLALFWYLFGTGTDIASRQRPHWLAVLGIESFFVYIIHLIFLFGWLTNPHFNLVHRLGPSQGVGETALFTVGLLVLLAPLALAWRFLKSRHPLLIAGVHWWFWLIFLSIFIRNPY